MRIVEQPEKIVASLPFILINEFKKNSQTKYTQLKGREDLYAPGYFDYNSIPAIK